MNIYRRHNCTRKHRTTRTLAACMFPRAAWVTGQGTFAVLAWCRVLTVTLHESESAATTNREWIDSTGCGGRCARRHEVARLEVAP